MRDGSHRRYWQIAAGADGHQYDEEFLRYGLAFVGGEGNEQVLQDVQEGDCVLLKRGRSQVVAAGLVVQRSGRIGGHARKDQDPSKEWLHHYDGWDLPAYRYIDWKKAQPPARPKGLTRSAICQVHHAELRRLAESMLFGNDGLALKTTLEQEPAATRVLDDDQLLTQLVACRPAIAELLRARLPRMRDLVRHYSSHWSEVREHETRTFLVLPFLQSLGWREEQVKIELPVRMGKSTGRADVVCFGQDWKGAAKAGKPALVIETKGFSIGLKLAGVQAAEYAMALNCDWAVASNGYCYKVLQRLGPEKEPGKAYRPVAYLSIRRPTDRYPLDPGAVAGAAEALQLLLPPKYLG